MVKVIYASLIARCSSTAKSTVRYKRINNILYKVKIENVTKPVKLYVFKISY